MIDRLLVSIGAGLLIITFLMGRGNGGNIVASEPENYRPAIVSPEYLGMKK